MAHDRAFWKCVGDACACARRKDVARTSLLQNANLASSLSALRPTTVSKPASCRSAPFFFLASEEP
jgi:hypothetical protein